MAKQTLYEFLGVGPDASEAQIVAMSRAYRAVIERDVDPQERQNQLLFLKHAEDTLYFVRVELAHLYEALRIIHEIEHKPELRALVDRCDLRTRESYAEILKWVHGGSKFGRLQQLVGQLRHNLTFHYAQSETLIAAAISDRADRPEANLSSLTRASTAHRWRFNVADDIIDSIVVRQLWKVSRNADVRLEADKIADEVNSVLLRFLDFSGEFIWRYCE